MFQVEKIFENSNFDIKKFNIYTYTDICIHITCNELSIKCMYVYLRPYLIYLAILLHYMTAHVKQWRIIRTKKKIIRKKYIFSHIYICIYYIYTSLFTCAAAFIIVIYFIIDYCFYCFVVLGVGVAATDIVKVRVGGAFDTFVAVCWLFEYIKIVFVVFVAMNGCGIICLWRQTNKSGTQLMLK